MRDSLTATLTATRVTFSPSTKIITHDHPPERDHRGPSRTLRMDLRIRRLGVRIPPGAPAFPLVRALKSPAEESAGLSLLSPRVTTWKAARPATPCSSNRRCHPTTVGPVSSSFSALMEHNGGLVTQDRLLPVASGADALAGRISSERVPRASPRWWTGHADTAAARSSAASARSPQVGS